MFKYIKECHYWEILPLCMISTSIRVRVCVFCVPTSCLCCHTPADEEARLSGWCTWNLPGSCRHKPQVCPSLGYRHGPGEASIHVKHQITRSKITSLMCVFSSRLPLSQSFNVTKTWLVKLHGPGATSLIIFQKQNQCSKISCQSWFFSLFPNLDTDALGTR